MTIYAEQAAVLAALCDGALEQGRQFIKGVYVSSPAAPCPCGGCRQFINEFIAAGAFWVGEDESGGLQSGHFAELLPFAFSPDKLGVNS